MQNGLIVLSGPDGVRGHGISKFLETTAAIAQNAGVPYSLLDAAQIRSQFPVFAVEETDKAYLDRISGFVRPEACVAAQLALSRKYGAEIHVGEVVQHYEQDRSGVRVTTDVGSYSCDKLIVAAGSWLPGLLEKPEMSLFRITRQVLYWFSIRNENRLRCFKSDAFPVFIWLVPRSQPIYGFPALGAARDGIKIATEQSIVATNVTEIDRNVSDAEISEMYETYVRPFFPDLASECVRAEVCLYTEVDGARFIIDRMPGKDRIIVASPCSGHGFKHSAAIGELLAKMVAGEPHEDIEPFRFR